MSVHLCTGMVEAGNPTLNVAWIRGLALGLDSEVADDVDAFASCHVLDGDPSPADGENIADVGPELGGDAPARPAEEDVREDCVLVIVSLLVHIEGNLPPSGWCDVIAVAQRHHDLQVREIECTCMTVVNVPRQRAEADTVGRQAARLAVHASARADRIAVASFKVRATNLPLLTLHRA